MTAASVARRVAWSVLALSPGLVVLALTATGWLPVGLGVAATVVLAGFAPVLRGRPWRAWREDPGGLLAGLVAWCWVTCIDPSQHAAAVLAAVLAVALHQAFGGTGQSPFHPAAAAAAAVLLLAPATGSPLTGTPATLAFAAGGLAMLARGLTPPAAALGWFGGLGIGSLLASQHGATSGFQGLAPAHLLVAGFVLGDGGSFGMRTASRAVCGVTAGLLAATLPGPAALACAVLIANFFVPVVERALPPRATA